MARPRSPKASDAPEPVSGTRRYAPLDPEGPLPPAVTTRAFQTEGKGDIGRLIW
jgi:hypothetical protein